MSADLDLTALDDEGRAALERLIVTLADSKRMMGIRYSDWMLGAPSLETGISTSAMAQDEWGHARLLYAMLKDFGKDPVPMEHDRPASEYASIAPLDEEMPDWAALVAVMVLADGAITAMLRSFSVGTFAPARSRVPKMLAEEDFHSSLGAAWYRRLAEADGEALALLSGATRAMLPALLAWVGADDAAMKQVVSAGVIGSAEERLAAFRNDMRDILALIDVDVDSATGSDAWDEVRGRTPGQPADEAVARARGDLNRALLVE